MVYSHTAKVILVLGQNVSGQTSVDFCNGSQIIVAELIGMKVNCWKIKRNKRKGFSWSCLSFNNDIIHNRNDTQNVTVMNFARRTFCTCEDHTFTSDFRQARMGGGSTKHLMHDRWLHGFRDWSGVCKETCHF